MPGQAALLPRRVCSSRDLALVRQDAFPTRLFPGSRTSVTNTCCFQRSFLRKDLVRVEATVIEKTESWPKVNMRFWRRHNFQRKKSKRERTRFLPCWMGEGRYPSTRTRGRGSFSVSPEPLRAQPLSQHLIFPQCSLNFLGRRAAPFSSQSLKHWVCHHSCPPAPAGSCTGFGCQVTLPSLREGRSHGCFHMGWMAKPRPGCPSATLGPAVLGIPMECSCSSPGMGLAPGLCCYLIPFSPLFPSFSVIANPQTVLRINTIEIYPCLS